ncbi:LysR family transcriptional regulator [uncultured Ruegeria sp.]|uniref:LysR family transcriptional regulator n=1 Tax=uncultured Ruegeria sp. TaxID=259304 RepID=UPI0026048E4F|nr:LysR family transcriptional regulator [uncultured Ruegeria sp.]
MELSWLEDFMVLANNGNFSVSAAQRNMTQSAFSKRIKSLENWLGTELIDRRTFPAVLTPAGTEFREIAQTTLNAMISERGRLRTSYSSREVELRILGATTLLMLFAPRWLAELKDTCGDFSFSLKTQNFYTMVQALGDREVDLVLQYSHPSLPSLYDKSKFHSRVLAAEMFVPVTLAYSNGPPSILASGKPDDVRLLRYSRDGFLARVEDMIFRRNNFDAGQCRTIAESPTVEVLKNCVLMGQGIAWLPYSSVQSELETGNLVLAGSEAWFEQLEVRVYGLKEVESRLVQRIWGNLDSSLVG